MEYKEILNSLKDEYVHKYVVRLKDGSKKTLKLWNNGGIAVMDKGKRRRGHFLHSSVDDYANWESITLYKDSCDIFKRVIKRAEKAFEMLSESGLWGDKKKVLEHFLSMSEEEQRKLVECVTTDSYKFYLSTYPDKEYSWVGCSYVLFEQFIKEKCWKSINLDKWDKDFYIERISQAIKEKPKNAYVHKWHKGYDNSIEIRFDDTDGVLRGWYSEEYKNCANGWYYILLDATHAIYVEKD